jgi:hypothetical protein
LKELVNFHEIQQGGDHGVGLFNPAASTIPKWQTFTSEVDAKRSPVSVGP